MTNSILEIVELPDGQVVLRRSDASEGSSEPLASIHFSAEARTLLQGHAGDVGRGMMVAGLQIVGRMFQQPDPELVPEDEDHPVVH